MERALWQPSNNRAFGADKRGGALGFPSNHRAYSDQMSGVRASVDGADREAEQWRNHGNNRSYSEQMCGVGLL